jgi:hypothetical protein
MNSFKQYLEENMRERDRIISVVADKLNISTDAAHEFIIGGGSDKDYNIAMKAAKKMGYDHDFGMDYYDKFWKKVFSQQDFKLAKQVGAGDFETSGQARDPKTGKKLPFKFK